MQTGIFNYCAIHITPLQLPNTLHYCREPIHGRSHAREYLASTPNIMCVRFTSNNAIEALLYRSPQSYKRINTMCPIPSPSHMITNIFGCLDACASDRQHTNNPSRIPPRSLCVSPRACKYTHEMNMKILKYSCRA